MLERKELPKSYLLGDKSELGSRFHPDTGLFELPVSCEGCAAWVYIPEETEYSTWCVTVLLPSEAQLDGFLEESGWLDVANKERVILFLGQADADAWPNAVSGGALVAELDSYVDKKNGYDVQRFFSYLVGYDDGATAALEYATSNPGSYAGLACVGDFSFDCGAAEAKSDSYEHATYLRKSETSLPVSFFCNEKTFLTSGVLEHFKTRNNTKGECVKQGKASYWPADQTMRRDSVNAQLVGDILWLSTDFDIEKVPAAVVWEKLHRTIRTTGIDGGFLHPYRTAAQWGLSEKTCVTQGVERRWLEYIPQRNVSRLEKRPLVIFFHGNSQTGKSAVYANEWMNVAESRDFIACFPTGGLTKRDNDAFPVPGWNASAFEDLLDDDAFVREMVRQYVDAGMVDETRVYACGHSMGSAMTQRCAMALPDLFAAVASNSGVVCGGRLGSFDAPGVLPDAATPVWVQMGEFDIGGGSPEGNSDIRNTLDFWLSRFGLTDESKGEYLCGRYSNTVWKSKSGAPLVKMTTTLDKTHSITPQDAWLYYDEFFAHYSRKNGQLFYDGLPV